MLTTALFDEGIANKISLFVFAFKQEKTLSAITRESIVRNIARNVKHRHDEVYVTLGSARKKTRHPKTLLRDINCRGAGGRVRSVKFIAGSVEKTERT